MPKRYRVALLIDSSSSFGRAVLQGVIHYQQEHGPWIIQHRMHGLSAPRPAWLRKWNGDGVLMQAQEPSIVWAVVEQGLPAVDVTYNFVSRGIPRVVMDQEQMVRMAADHLLERRFERFGYLGTPRGPFPRVDERQDLFVDYLAAAGFACDVFVFRQQLASIAEREREQRRIANWLAQLVKPVGVFSGLLESGPDLLAACELAGISVPHEVAAIAAGNDDLICNLTNPPLSGVESGARRMGYEAAGLLHRQMIGEKVSCQPILLAPHGVIARASTDAFATEHPDLKRCLQFIRTHAIDGIKVEDVLQLGLTLSRRMLDIKFKQWLGRTIHEEIQRAQLERARQLLRDTELTVGEIAIRCGFTHTEYFGVVFKKKFGMSPTHYRDA